MTTKLISALRETAQALEDGTFNYLWTKATHCNCGSLFCALTGKIPSELSLQIPELPTGMKGSWNNIIGNYCPIAGKPQNALLSYLLECGLTKLDIINLEYLKDQKVLDRIDFTKFKRPKRKWYQFKERPIEKKLDYANKQHVVVYMRAWADLLEEKV
jgi:hypothetical protein